MPVDNQSLSKYLSLFGSLNRHPRKGLGHAPHKPVLLLAVLNAIEVGSIRDNLIPLSPALVANFRAYWRALVPAGTWQERMVYPFRYLVQEGWWELVQNNRPLTTKELGDPTSINQLSALIDGARLAPDLWELLQDRVALNSLRVHLLQVYFSTSEEAVSQKLPADALEYEAEKLIENAQSKFRPKKIREVNDDDGYYVRHSLFPRVVKSLYTGRCAICGLAVKTDTNALLIDAVHIMPFHLFHNDDPRNGMALCKNHHWGFDSGWFAIAPDYTVVLSPRLQNSTGYLTASAPLLLPSSDKLAPAVEALAWHFTHVFQS